jgi:hypothetical protein
MICPYTELISTKLGKQYTIISWAGGPKTTYTEQQKPKLICHYTFCICKLLCIIN